MQSKTDKLLKKKIALFHAIANDAWTANRYQQSLDEIAKMPDNLENKTLSVQISKGQHAYEKAFEKIRFTADSQLLISLLVAKRNEFREYVRLVAAQISVLENRTEQDEQLLSAIDKAWEKHAFVEIMKMVDEAYPNKNWVYRGDNM